MAGPANSKLTANRQKRICDALRQGDSRSLAAKKGGIGRRTVFEWMRKGTADDGAYTDDAYGAFRMAVEHAEAEWEQTLLNRISTAAERPASWGAAAWILERRWPDRYGASSKQQVELSGRGGGPVEVDLSVARDRLLQGIDRLASRGGQDDG